MSVTLFDSFLRASRKKERHGYCIKDGIMAHNWPSLSDLTWVMAAGTWMGKSGGLLSVGSYSDGGIY
jgi:hypothetical protein